MIVNRMGKRLHEKNVAISNRFFVVNVNLAAFETRQFDFTERQTELSADLVGNLGFDEPEKIRSLSLNMIPS